MPKKYRPEGPPKCHGRIGEDVDAWLFQLEESKPTLPEKYIKQQSIHYVALSL
jgi:hypothetical protein